MLRSTLALLVFAVAASAHPMGNFSVNHYSRLVFRADRADLTYVLDIAEIPTFQLMEEWHVDGKDQGALDTKARLRAKDWAANLSLAQSGHRLPLHIESVTARTTEGAGGMPVLRVSIKAESSLKPGAVKYEDSNFPGRAGWKEIVVDHDAGSSIQSSTQGSQDLSKGLTIYPTDPGTTPPQDITAEVRWSPVLRFAESRKPLVEKTPAETPAAVVQTPIAVPPPAPSFSQQQPDSPGSVVRGDYLSRLLQRKELGFSIILIGIVVAFGLGAMHALSPGHGKTIVAAYLVGSRGTLKHAGLLGFVVTFTHTFTVFLLGLGVLFFQNYVVPEKIVPVLAAISGLSIVFVGVTLLYQRAVALMNGGEAHAYSHSHSHELAMAAAGPSRTRIGHLLAAEKGETDEGPGEPFEHDHGDGLLHSHGGSAHSHMIEGEITLGSLITLGISGGLVPCPSALILMLSAIALGHAGLGLMLLIGFSTGLAVVLMAIGMLAIYAKQLLPDTDVAKRPIFRLIPVFSAVVVIVLGLVMTAASAGWIQPLRFLS